MGDMMKHRRNGRLAAHATTLMLLLLTVLTASACNAPAEDEAVRADSARSPQTQPAAYLPEPAVPITATGIGPAQRGMTIGVLRAALPAGDTLGATAPYMVDIDGMPITRNGDTLYHVLIIAGESSTDITAIENLATTSTKARTPEGIGPGSTIAEAAKKYGAPTLSYSTNDESREYAAFPRLPSNVRFRVAPASDSAAYAGLYDTNAEFNQTTRYDPHARISMVIVSLR